MRRLLPLFVLVLAAGCSRAPSPEQIVPKEDVEFAQRFLSDLAARDFIALERSMDPAMKRPELLARVERGASAFPRDTPRSVKLVEARRHEGVTTTQFDVAFEYEFPSSWLLARMSFQRTPAGLIVRGITVKPMSQSLAYQNRFTFTGKGVGHYVFFAVAVLVPVVMAWALYLVFRTAHLPMRWLWALAVLVGVGQASLNWTTNQVNVSAVSLRLLGSGYVRANPWTPIVLTTSLPLGAILFFIKRATGFGDWEEEEMGHGQGPMGEGGMSDGRVAMGDGEATDTAHEK